MLKLNWKHSKFETYDHYVTGVNLNEFTIKMEVEINQKGAFAVFSIAGQYSDQCTLDSHDPVLEAETWFKQKLFSIREALQEPELEAFLLNI